MNSLNAFSKFFLPVLILAAAAGAQASQLSADASDAIPQSVQQLVSIDYHAMENSTAAMDLRSSVMPPELKRFEDALKTSGLNENHDVEQLTFALFRAKEDDDRLSTVGVAQGQFPVQDILANFRKQKLKVTLVRTNRLYPLSKTGMVVCFINPSTMVFGDVDAVTRAMDARDGVAPSLLKNPTIMDAMKSVDSEPLWSIMDKKGTQTMMRQILGEAGSASDFDSVKKHLEASWYSMDFQHGVKFDLTISTGDNFASATLSSLLSTGLTLRKASGTDAEKQALSATTISSDAGRLSIHFSTGDSQFNALLHSPLFKGVVMR
jgi:hypothetical protein